MYLQSAMLTYSIRRVAARV